MMIRDNSEISLAQTVNGVALQLKPDLTRDEWVEVGQNLGRAAQGIQWFIGDWLNYGVSYGYVSDERYDIAEEITHMSNSWLKVCAWVARSIKPEDRRPELSFDHHKKIASLPAGVERSAILHVAVEQRLSSRALYDLSTAVMSPTEPVTALVTTPPPAAPSVQMPSGVIELGPHRLIVGDCTDPSVIDQLFEGQPNADILWTDPPYGVDYVGKTSEELVISNDQVADLPELLAGSFVLVDKYLRDGSALYICTGFKSQGITVDVINMLGWRFSVELVWVKNTFAMGWGDYHAQHESMIYGFKGDSRRWYGPRNRTTIFGLENGEFTIPKPGANRDHPTAKPPRLIFEQLRNSALAGEIVLDPFAGGGSTMIAAHQMGMRAFMIELDPKYAQAIVDRYHEEIENAG